MEYCPIPVHQYKCATQAKLNSSNTAGIKIKKAASILKQPRFRLITPNYFATAVFLVLVIFTHCLFIIFI